MEISLATAGSAEPVFTRYDVDKFELWLPMIQTFWACGSPATYEPECNLDGNLDGARAALERMGDLIVHPLWASFFALCQEQDWFRRRFTVNDNCL
jgi:hypothetical protein